MTTIDMALGEFVVMLDGSDASAEVIAAAQESDTSVKELVLLVRWRRPLHVVIVVDEDREQERIVTIYEPYPSEWTTDFRRKR